MPYTLTDRYKLAIGEKIKVFQALSRAEPGASEDERLRQEWGRIGERIDRLAERMNPDDWTLVVGWDKRMDTWYRILQEERPDLFGGT